MRSAYDDELTAPGGDQGKPTSWKTNSGVTLPVTLTFEFAAPVRLARTDVALRNVEFWGTPVAATVPAPSPIQAITGTESPDGGQRWGQCDPVAPLAAASIP